MIFLILNKYAYVEGEGLAVRSKKILCIENNTLSPCVDEKREWF